MMIQAARGPALHTRMDAGQLCIKIVKIPFGTCIIIILKNMKKGNTPLKACDIINLDQQEF